MRRHYAPERERRGLGWRAGRIRPDVNGGSRVIEQDELSPLVAAAQAGDRAALERLLVRLRPMVLRRCSRFLPHYADAEEAAQDALLSISLHLAEYRGRGSFLGWVTVIASNAARSTYRSMRRRAEDSSAVLPEGADPRTTSVIAGTRLDLMESLAALEEQHPALVESFVLRDLGDLTYLQVAEITGAPLGTVKDRIHQARRFMRERLGAGA
ncbi:sigma-70 family RNA polymerase sigma factor [Streptomyces liangshanensis]|uniref:Sigma-70 family RNA polymerase sigma factor n=1 Tax=Streptomyces liangshanensis TaxID=2717324 RepID=A0A6G9H347_9ACTN|nr:sigma-70 family RNA polymerase sigma factor [Streptomyces liangshanensis]